MRSDGASSAASEPEPRPRRRARSIEEFLARIQHFISAEGMRRALGFRPRASDVIIATHPKAGTTWMQQIVHGLRTKGDMDFGEITEVTPWIEIAHDMGIDLTAEQKAHPRVFKSHLNGDQVPGPCRYICVIRDPGDTMTSFYHFMDGWFLEPGCVSIDAFVRYMAFRDHTAGDYWTHLLTWWRRRHEPGVLLLCYEDLKEDLEREVRRVAAFLGLASDPQTLAVATAQASFEFMKAHESQFDEHLGAEARNASCGLPDDARTTKVRSGEIGGHRTALGPSTLELLRERWSALVEAETGLVDYAGLRRALVAARQPASERSASQSGKIQLR